MEELVKYMKALVLLQLNGSKEEDEQRAGPDLVLSRAGFTGAEIADMLNRTPAAVLKAIQRAKKGRRTGKAPPRRRAKR